MLETVEQLFHSSPESEYKKGTTGTKFLRIDEQYGFKIFRDECERDRNHELQNTAAVFGLAPRALDKFDIDGMSFGFITEAVTETLDERSHGRLRYHEDCCDECLEYNELIDNLIGIGMQPCDMWGKNVGYMSDGRLVCIDFGDFDDE